MGTITKSVALILVLLATASSASAQLPTATILGIVRDSGAGVMPGVTLTVTNADTALSRSTVSEPDGSYRFPALPVGRYEGRAAIDGFRTAGRDGLTLTVGQEAVVNFSLEVGALAETVSVTISVPCAWKVIASVASAMP